MNDRINKTSICSIVFLDIIDYSKKPDSEQIEVKNQFNALINNALKDIAQNDRIILDTGDGAAIACNGSPEDALFISLTIRDEILKSNIHNATPLYVRFGINLGPVRVVNDINGQPNIIGDGINVAQRIMSFAKPNQILVSRSYYEVTSRLTQEISQMFDYSGIKHDKHVREHEVYSVRLLKNQTSAEDAPLDSSDDVAPSVANTINWKYVALALPAILAFIVLFKLNSVPIVPKVIIAKPAATARPVASNNNGLLPNETVEKTPARTTAALNSASAKSSTVLQQKTLETMPAATKSEKAHKKSTWTNIKDNVTQGKDKKCTQAEVSMNQCR
jgi:Adenylate and Guanylate cyclase catalytic domain